MDSIITMDFVVIIIIIMDSIAKVKGFTHFIIERMIVMVVIIYFMVFVYSFMSNHLMLLMVHHMNHHYLHLLNLDFYILFLLHLYLNTIYIYLF